MSNQKKTTNPQKSDNRLNLILKLAVGFLVLSVLFCGTTIIYTQVMRQDAEQKRLENEVKVAELQMPEQQTPQPDGETDGGAEQPEEGQEAEEVQPDEAVVPQPDAPVSGGKPIIVLDAGHGKSSSSMSKEEKIAEGYEYNESRGSWGEWRHYKNGTFGDDCYGSGCTLTAPSNGSCWYPMGNADRNTEPEINLNNTLAAKRYLEQMGYEVRLTRESNDQNPSMNKRVSYCFPNNDITQQPDASLYVCIHSNAGGGRGTSYIALEDTYMQSYIPQNYLNTSNQAGDIINRKVAAASGLSANGPIGNEGWLILFNKCPVPIAYLEIGFYDNSSDLAIIRANHEQIGKAIAEGVDEYLAGA